MIRLPAYAPDLERSLGNPAVTGVDHLPAIIKNRLKSIQHGPAGLLDGFLAHTPA